MTQRSDYDEIHDSIINGQFKQAIDQMNETEYSLEGMLDYFYHDLADKALALKAAKLFMRSKEND